MNIQAKTKYEDLNEKGLIKMLEDIEARYKSGEIIYGA